MVAPFITDTDLDDLRTLQGASLRDRGTVERWVVTTAENEEESGSWVVVDENVPVTYVPMSSRTAEVAAATGVVATGILKQRVTGDIRPGDRVIVRGVRGKVRFQRLGNIGLALQGPGRTVQRMGWTDTDLTRE